MQSELETAICEEIKYCIEARLNHPDRFGGIKIFLPDNKEVILFIHLDRSQSPQGDYTPPWELHEEEIEAIKNNLLQLGFEELKNINFYDFKNLIEVYNANFFPVYTERVPRDSFGGYVDVGTYRNNCSKKEFEEVVNALAPRLWGYGNKDGPEL